MDYIYINRWIEIYIYYLKFPFKHLNFYQVRITGFKDGQSQFGEFPWVVIVLRRETNGDKKELYFEGGGTLINSQVILTAAHKVNE